MNAMQGVMWELGINAEEMISEMISDNNGLMPPGFRFHPTDEELITFYLASKVFNGGPFCGVDIMEVDLNRCEPWELPDMAKMGEREWYFYSLRDRKYPTGLRTNRATGAGYWKATGKDREVHSASSGNSLVGMKKTLVFYKGRAPRGEKTKWVLHEYRLEGDFSCRLACKEEWVICRIFNKSEIVSNNQHKKNNQLHPKQSSLFSTHHGLNHHSSTSTNHPLSNLQTLESPIQSLLNNDNPFLINHHDHHHHDLNQLSNLFIPQQEQCQFQEDASATSFSNWLDVYEMAIGSSTSQLDFGALC